MLAIRPSRREMYADDATFLWKSILRSLAIVLALIAIGLIGWLLTHQVGFFPTDISNNYDFAYYYYDWPYYNDDFWFLPWEFITCGLSVLWNVANVLVLVLRNRPIHPGANVACDLVLWLGFVVTGAMATVRAETYFWWYPSDYNDAFYDNDDFPIGSYANGSAYYILPDGTLSNTSDPTSTSSPCQGFPSCAAQEAYNSSLNHKGIVIVVGAALSFVVLLMHFALFVSACRYTNARRVDAKAAVLAEKMFAEKMMMMSGGGGRGGAATAAAAEEERRNPNAGFVPISEPVEQQAPLDYGMPPAPTGMTVGDLGKKRAADLVGDEEEQQQQQRLGRGTRYSYEQPEVVGGGGSSSGGGEHVGPSHGHSFYEA